MQFNDSGVFGGTNDFAWDNTNKALSLRDGADGWDLLADGGEQIRQIGGAATANLFFSNTDFSSTTTLNSAVFGRQLSSANIGNQSTYFGNNHTGFAGQRNTIIGFGIGGVNGSDKTAIGNALTVNGNNAVAIGYNNTVNAGGIVIGVDSSQTGSNSIVMSGDDEGNSNYFVMGSNTMGS